MKKHLILATAVVLSAGSMQGMSAPAAAEPTMWESAKARVGSALNTATFAVKSAGGSVSATADAWYQNPRGQWEKSSNWTKGGIVAAPVALVAAGAYYVYNTYFATSEEANKTAAVSADAVTTPAVVDATPVVETKKSAKKAVVKAAPRKAAPARRGCRNGRCHRR